MPSSRVGSVVGLLAFVVAVLAAVASLVTAVLRPAAHVAPRGPAVAGSGVAAPGGAQPVTGGMPPSAPVAGATPQAVTAGRVEIRYHFDAGLTPPILDERGRLPLWTAASAGGSLSTVERPGGGLAVRFPPPCAHYGAADCPRATLQSAPVESLNPGTGPIRFGATVRIAPNETTRGANVLQKGYSTAGGQFKLQVDGAAGRPSCVVVGTDSARIYVAPSSVSVADGQWHTVDCARLGGQLTLSVDGVARGGVSVATTLSVYNTEPLRIGGKGNSPNNDQFVGSLDDVYVVLGDQ